MFVHPRSLPRLKSNFIGRNNYYIKTELIKPLKINKTSANKVYLYIAQKQPLYSYSCDRCRGIFIRFMLFCMSYVAGEMSSDLTFTLRNGKKIPAVGLGTWLVSNNNFCFKNHLPSQNIFS